MKSPFCLAALCCAAVMVLNARAEEAPASANLPELPSVSGNTPTIDTGANGVPASPLPTPRSQPATRQMPSAEQLEQLKKDKNWLVEGMKERQAEDQAAANRPPEDMSQSIIDMVLRKQKPNDPDSRGAVPQSRMPETARTTPAPGSRPAFQPAISTSAFQPLPSSTGDEALRPGGMESILARERALAGQPAYNPPLSASAAPARDPLANPFGNLPIPEAALPSSRRPAGAYSVNDPMLQNAWANPGPQAPVLNANPAAAGPGVGNPGLVLNDNGAPAPRAAIEQPYDYLRAQEEQRRREQMNSNRPQVRDLRNPIPDPSEARLF